MRVRSRPGARLTLDWVVEVRILGSPANDKDQGMLLVEYAFSALSLLSWLRALSKQETKPDDTHSQHRIGCG